VTPDAARFRSGLQGRRARVVVGEGPIVQCGTKLFVGQSRLDRVLQTRPTRWWTRFRRANEAARRRAERRVGVNHGESARTITLTGIRFAVTRRRQFDNGGRGYAVVGTDGFRAYFNDGRWRAR